ncbi:MAG: hypothetical protein PVS3B3_06720 [Ktedonobacteraceae bacterium]
MARQNEQVDGLLEVTTALQDLARLSHQGVAMTAQEAPPTVAVALLERLMLLCRVSRGAIFLAVPHPADGEPIVSSSVFNGKTFRLFALHGVKEEEIQPFLMISSSENPWTSPPRDPSWVHWRLPLTLSFPILDQKRTGTMPSLHALLLFGWVGQDEEQRLRSMKHACVVLPLVVDAVGTVIIGVLSSEYIEELEASADVKALRAMELLKAELLATVSHELRSPLASIQGYAATLLRHDRRISREERHEFLVAIHEASDRLAGVIDALLEVSELETGTMKIRRTPLNIARLVREAVMVAAKRRERVGEADGIMPSAQQQPTFVVRLEDRHGEPTDDELIIEGDQSHLKEVLDHLFKNAIMYAPEGKTIEVVVRPVLSSDDLRQFSPSSQEIGMKLTTLQQRFQKVVVICVHDNGRGIPTKHLTRIFDPFYRVDTRLIRETNGLGLGLAVCRHIVELHDGMLWVESELEKGSTFYVCLPVDGNIQSEKRVERTETVEVFEKGWKNYVGKENDSPHCG